MAKRKPTAPPGAFFARQLKGETPLSPETAQALYAFGHRMLIRAPWRDIDGDDVVLFDVAPGQPKPVAGTILGRAGEVFGLKIYENDFSLRYLMEILEHGHAPDPTTFLTHRQALSAEFVPKRELTKTDRDFLQALGHRASPAAAGSLQLRAGRPGYGDWYPTEEEGQRLLYFLEAVVWLGDTHNPAQLSALADRAQWPCLRRVESGSFRVDWVDRPPLPPLPKEPEVIPPPELIEELARLKPRGGATGPVVEMELAHTPLRVGGVSERPSLTTVVLIVDAHTGAVLKPDLFPASAALGPQLMRAFADFVRSVRVCPSEVRHYGSLAPLQPLFEALGVKLRQRSSLPAFGAAMDGLMQFMGR
ncbi:MAG: hypothetical protein IT162_00965 [Bryobacterales bacterium]|nr:hypothetical protein [Bryobacterales bacterium]